jgi:hypothetical protein
VIKIRKLEFHVTNFWVPTVHLRWFWICNTPLRMCSHGHSESWEQTATAAQCHWDAVHKVVSNASRPISTSRD